MLCFFPHEADPGIEFPRDKSMLGMQSRKIVKSLRSGVRKRSNLTRIDLFWPQEDTTMKLLSVSWISGVTVIKKDLFTD